MEIIFIGAHEGRQKGDKVDVEPSEAMTLIEQGVAVAAHVTLYPDDVYQEAVTK